MRTNLQELVQPNAGVSLLLVGALFENLFGPTLYGWGLLFLGAGYLWVWPQRVWRRPPFLTAFMVLVVCSLFSLWVTAETAVSQGPVNSLIVNALLTVAVIGWLVEMRRTGPYLWCLMCVGVVLAAAAPFIIEWQKNKGGIIPDAFYTRFPLLLSDPVHPNIMASLMLLFFPLPLLLFLDSASSRWTPRGFATAAAAALMLFILFLTRSRAGYAVGTVGVVMLLLLTQHRRIALLLLLLGAIGLGLLWGGGGTSTAAADLSNPSTLAFRLNVWQLALEMVRDFPYTGVGMSQFNPVAERLYPYPPMTSPGAHNLYLQVAVDLGLIALLAFLVILLGALGHGWRRYQPRDRSTLLLGSLIGLSLLALHGLIDATVWGTRMSIAPWLLIAPILADVERARTKESGG